MTEVSVERLFSNLAPERTPINMASEHLVFAVEHKKGKQSNKNVLLLFPPCLYGQIKITWVFWTKTVPKNSILLYIYSQNLKNQLKLMEALKGVKGFKKVNGFIQKKVKAYS